jgi:nicotinate-nucleotide adenylyltransferase
VTANAPPVGVLGGTFDPVHLGHLAIADEVRRRMRLSRVLLTPTAVPPHKTAERLSDADHRESMIRLALQGREGLELCALELHRDRVCYTIDTLRSLRDGTPPVQPLFLLGTDSLLQLQTWRDYSEMLREFDLVVVDRAGQGLAASSDELDSEISRRIVVLAGSTPGASSEPGRGGRVFHLRFDPVAISSSAIRARAAAGLELTGLVPPAVAKYIDRTALYRPEKAR